MNCADVCIDHYYDETNDFYAEAIVTARKLHKCCECGDPIAAGSRYERASGKSDGDVWTSKTCLVCLEVRKAFVCGTWIFGQLWESIEEAMFPDWDKSGPIDCLAKLETLAARDKCRTQYAAYREDRA